MKNIIIWTLWIAILVILLSGCNDNGAGGYEKEDSAGVVMSDATGDIVTIGDWTIQQCDGWDSCNFITQNHIDSSFEIHGDTMKVIKMMWDEYFRNIDWKRKYDSLILNR